jgi:hypothetical protein
MSGTHHVTPRIVPRSIVASVFLIALAAAPPVARAGLDPWADSVVEYLPGAAPAAGFTDPAVSLGAPERFTGELTPFPGVVSIFSPPFGTDEIVSIGEGGRLTVRFDVPVADDPANPYGVDLIIFGNTGFVLGDFVNLSIGTPAELFGADFATVEVSADGIDFFAVGSLADALFPTQGFLDSGPFDAAPGSAPTNFLKPVNPALTLSDFDGLTYAGALALYDGSGGGTPIDIASTGLASISYVRVSLLDDGNAGTELNAEIDAFATVPEPGSLALFAIGAALALGRRRRWERTT